MHVMEDELSSTILTAGEEGSRGGTVTNEICTVDIKINRARIRGKKNYNSILYKLE